MPSIPTVDTALIVPAAAGPYIRTRTIGRLESLIRQGGQIEIMRCFLLLLALCTTLAVQAETLQYDLDIPSNDSITYELELDIRHPGQLELEASWDCRRVVTFKLQPPHPGQPVMRRSSPSPIRFTTSIVDPGDEPWKLSIYVMPGGDAGVGKLTVRLPDAPIPPKMQTSPESVTPAEVDLWKQPLKQIPNSAPTAAVQLVDSVERLRRLVVGPSATPDICRWQLDGLRFLAHARNGVLNRTIQFDFGSRELFRTIAQDIASVEQLRRTDDPLLRGPPPADPDLARTWHRIHRDRLQPLEAKLDQTFELASGTYANSLAEKAWVARLVSCVVASQRNFADRARVGTAAAVNREMTLDQWDRLLAVSDALMDLSRATAPPEGQTIRLGQP